MGGKSRCSPTIQPVSIWELRFALGSLGRWTGWRQDDLGILVFEQSPQMVTGKEQQPSLVYLVELHSSEIDFVFVSWQQVSWELLKRVPSVCESTSADDYPLAQ